MYIDPHVHMPGFEHSNRTSSARRSGGCDVKGGN